jgi:HKD family nuclease
MRQVAFNNQKVAFNNQKVAFNNQKVAFNNQKVNKYNALKHPKIHKLIYKFKTVEIRPKTINM